MMSEDKNSLGQPIGFPIEEWQERPHPPHSYDWTILPIRAFKY